jgi:hypothetical protein
VVRAAANERVCGVAGVLAIMRARGEGGARSVGVCRGWRSGAFSAWSQRRLAWPGRVVQWLALLAAGTGSGGGVLASSLTRLARLVLLVACCRPWGGNGSLGLLTIDDNGQLTVVLEIS